MNANKKIYFGEFFVNVFGKKDLLGAVTKALSHNSGQAKVFYYLNTGHFFFAKENIKYNQVFTSAHYCYLNSFYLSFIFKILFGKKIEKLNVEDFIYDILSFCGKKRLSIFLLGAKEVVLNNAVKNINEKYPMLQVFNHHGYFNKSDKVITQINKTMPDLLIVGLGAKKQEEWVYHNKNKLKSIKSIITVGNFIDILGEEKRVPPYFLRKTGLEWLYRLIREPRRLWKRYLVGGWFVFRLFLNYFVFGRKSLYKS